MVIILNTDNKYNSKQKEDGYRPMPSGEFIARAEEIIKNPNTKGISLDEFLKKVEDTK